MSITFLATSDTELRRERTVGPALHRGSTVLPCPAESPWRGESGATVTAIRHGQQ